MKLTTKQKKILAELDKEMPKEVKTYHPTHDYYLRDYFELQDDNGVSGEEAYFSKTDKGKEVKTRDWFRYAQLMIAHKRKGLQAQMDNQAGE